MSEKEISKNRVIAQAEKLRDKKDADLKLAQASWCGNEPHELEGPVLPKNPDDPCGSTPVVLQGRRIRWRRMIRAATAESRIFREDSPNLLLIPALGSILKSRRGEADKSEFYEKGYPHRWTGPDCRGGRDCRCNMAGYHAQ